MSLGAPRGHDTKAHLRPCRNASGRMRVGGESPWKPGTPRRSRGVSLQPQSRRGGSDITQGETGDDDTPFTLTYDRCRAATARRPTSMAGGGPGRKGPGRRPVPGPRDVRPAQVPRRRAAASSSGCRLRWRCRTSWSLRCCCCRPRAWPPKRPRFFRLQLFFSSFGLFLLFLPVLSECSSALPVFPLFLPFGRMADKGRKERKACPWGRPKERRKTGRKQQTDTFLSTFGDFFSTFCDPLLSFRCCQVPSTLSFRPRSADFSQRSLSRRFTRLTFFLSSFHHAIPF